MDIDRDERARWKAEESRGWKATAKVIETITLHGNEREGLHFPSFL